MSEPVGLPNVSVNVQSSIRVETSSGRVVRFDPLDVVGEPHDADVICVTHEHFDHFSLGDIAHVAKAGTTLVVPASLGGQVAGTAMPRIVALSEGEVVRLGGSLSIEAVIAYNPRKAYHARERGWLGYVLDDAGVRYYAMGDTDDTPEARAVLADVVFVPIGGTYTMDAAEAAAFVNATRPGACVPVHYGSYVGTPSDFDAFSRAVDPRVRVIRKLGRR